MEGSTSELELKVALLAHELDEARAEQAATANVLKVISSSGFDLGAVLTTLIRSAIELCEAARGVIWLRQGEQLVLATHVDCPPEWVAFAEANPITPAADAQTTSGLAAFTGEVVNVEDIFSDPRFRSLAGHALGNYRAGLAVPLKRDGRVEGVIALSRPQARLFTERQVGLVQTFADQAVIAIDNARLFEEVRARDSALAASLDQQTATSEILRVISMSPTDVQPVFETIVRNAVSLCGGLFANVFRFDGDMLHFVAACNVGPDYVDLLKAKYPMRPNDSAVAGRVMLTKSVVRLEDALADPNYDQRFPSVMGWRRMLGVPMLREGEPLGVIVVGWAEPGPVPRAQEDLLKTFADQAVIAIENVRLFDEVQSRNVALSEALEQQTATSEILRVISSSPTNVQPVFDAIAENAARLCEAFDAVIRLKEGDTLALGAHFGPIPVDPKPWAISRKWTGGRAVLERATIHVPDLTDAAEEFPEGWAMAHRVGHRTMLAVPLLREGEAIGVIGARRAEVKPFSEAQISLLKTFADQAVIAIENARLFDEVQTRNLELSEALEQQTATGAILQVIAASPTDIHPVLSAVTQSAAQLCDAYDATTFLRRGDILEVGAHHGPISVDFGNLPVARDLVSGRSVVDRAPVHVHDLWAARDEFPTGSDIARRIGFRTILATPLLREGEAIGALMIRRAEVRPFSDKQIALLKTFADQAVIAIENVRLFEEVQTRNRELSDALEQQVATGTILQAIAASPTDIQPVLNTVAESAARLCGARDANIMLRRGDVLSVVAHHGAIPIDYTDLPIVREMVAGSVVLDRKPIHVHDMAADGEFPASRTIARRLGARTLLAVPLLREDEAIGVLMIRRDEVRPFSDKQIELIKTFADQAVIAIENVRLFEEVQARTAELTESLQQQTATADVLKVISRSAFDLQPVLRALVDSAIRLCGADKGAITLREGDALRFMAGSGQSPELRAYEAAHPHKLGRGTFQGRAAIEGRTIHVPDALADAEYERKETAIFGIRAVLAVPLKRGAEVIGVFGLARATVGPFAPRQIELVESFADQAVIAIENARLFEEVQARTAELTESLKQQTATADVLKVISRSAFDLQAVLDTLAESAARLCEADIVDFYRLADDGFEWAATFGEADTGRDHTTIVRQPGRGSASGRVLLERKTVHIPDFEADAEFTFVDVARKRGIRAILGVPLMRGDALVGLLLVMRKAPGAFAAKQIELAETFADQAVIAIENARLFDEVQARTAELTEALQQQTATADVLKVISRSAFDLQVVLDTLVESAVRLCRADKGGILRPFDGVFRYVALYGYQPEFQQYVDVNPPVAGRGSAVGRVVEERKAVHILDALADPDYTMMGAAQAGDFRTVLAIPLLREGDLIGVFVMTRAVARSFTERDIDLVQTFADQAVIAIENARLFDEVQARTSELSESLQQQIATADVLKVISRSAFNLQSVLETLIESAAALCKAERSGIYMLDGDVYRLAAEHGMLPEMREFELLHPNRVGRDTYVGRTALEKGVVHVPDVSKDPEYRSQEIPQIGGFASILSVPLMREGMPIGVFCMGRVDPGPFTERQIELVQTFADQAVIAIENVRLFEEVQARNRDLMESLERQTAMSDILRVISRSPTDVQPVFETIAESAARLCSARFCTVFRFDGELIHFAAQHGLTPEAIDAQRRAFPMLPGRGSGASRAILSAVVEQIPDVDIDPDYQIGETARAMSARSVLAVPMLRDGRPVGSINLGRPEPGYFPSRQIELLQTFADQAVIAIENVRLFEEVQARTRELTESLERQTAASEILRVIARSPTDVQPVFDTIATSVAQLCAARYCIVFGFDGALVHFVAEHGLPPEAIAGNRQVYPMPPGRGSAAARAILSRTVEQIPDVEADPDFAHASITRRAKVRSLIAVPMLKDDVPAGAIVVARPQTGLFPERQIDLLRTFADQAVIAIENVRLFEEVQARTAELSEALQQQTATADVLKVISRSAFDLKSVLQTLVESAVHLCEADKGMITRLKDGRFYRAEAFGFSPEFIDYYFRTIPVEPGRGTVTGRALLEGKVIHIADVEADPEYTWTEGQKLGGFRSLVGVPLLREGLPVGVMALTRSEPRPFTQKQIELVQTFADQAVIAIENARLFEEVQARTAELGEALQQQTATADVLKVISRSAFNLQPVLQTLVESAIRLCGAEKGVITLREGDDLRVTAGSGVSPELRAFEEKHPHKLGRGTFHGRAAIEGTTIHIPDALADPEYQRKEFAIAGNFRAVLCVPLKLGSEVLGVFGLARAAAGPFTPRQIELVESFADQAVIAIENARLFEEVQAKTRDLEESLTFQKATSSVLEVIGRSASDLQPVLDVILDTAADLCHADMSVLRLMREGTLQHVASSRRNDPAVVQHARENPILPADRSSVAGRVALAGHTIHIPDVAQDAEYTFYRTLDTPIGSVLGVPLVQDGKVAGVIALLRRLAQPFTQRQIELVETFADQAVIAIENVRLFEEVQERTREVTEALEQQTATSEVLKVISSSPTDIRPVLDAVGQSAARLCEANNAVIFLLDGSVLRQVGAYGHVPTSSHPIQGLPVNRDTVTGRAVAEGRPVHVHDLSAEDGEYPEGSRHARIDGHRTTLATPLLSKGVPIGAILIRRMEVRPFSQKHIDLLTTFADQAVIAIANVRLFDEVKHRTEELSRSLQELRTAQDRLVQTEKLASLGQLTAGIAHEIKNPLNFVNNFSSLSGELIDELREALASTPVESKLRAEIAELIALLKGNLEKVVQHGKRADSIVKNMLLHSRSGSGEHRPTGINAIVEESLNLAYHGARAEKQGFNITMQKSLDPAAGDIDLYPQEITRVLLNLISNGFYAATKRKAQADGSYEPILAASTRNLGDSVEIRIRDNGTGIPPEVKEKMFNPFFTTKPAGEGTGLGLSLSHDIIVKQHAGTIEVETEPGAFTEFRIVLPRGAASLGKSGGVA